jgi:hypothetical protein
MNSGYNQQMNANKYYSNASADPNGQTQGANGLQNLADKNKQAAAQGANANGYGTNLS